MAEDLKTPHSFRRVFTECALILAALALAGCGASDRQPDVKAEAPPAARVEHEADANLVKVDHPDFFPVATAAARTTTTELNVTGVVSADVSRTMPVISLTSGRVVEIRARLGDEVTKGQLLMRVQSAEVSGAFSDYRKATTDEARSEERRVGKECRS